MVASPAPVLDLLAEVPVARTVTGADLAEFMDELTSYHAYHYPCTYYDGYATNRSLRCWGVIPARTW